MRRHPRARPRGDGRWGAGGSARAVVRALRIDLLQQGVRCSAPATSAGTAASWPPGRPVHTR